MNKPKKYEHIGWVKYCTTSTSWPINEQDDPRFVKPWPCQASFFSVKPPLEYDESSKQFFWKKLYTKWK